MRCVRLSSGPADWDRHPARLNGHEKKSAFFWLRIPAFLKTLVQRLDPVEAQFRKAWPLVPFGLPRMAYVRSKNHKIDYPQIKATSPEVPSDDQGHSLRLAPGNASRESFA